MAVSDREVGLRVSAGAVDLEELERGFDAVAEPLIFLLVRARKSLLSASARTSYMRSEYVAGYDFKGGEVVYPLISVRRGGKQFKLVAWFVDICSPAIFNVYYSRGSLVFHVLPNTAGLKMSKDPLAYSGYSYVFPPSSLDSYLFFYLNRSVDDILSDYMGRFEGKLPERFRERLEAFKLINEKVGAGDRLPKLGVVSDPFTVKLDINYVSSDYVKMLGYSTRYGMNYFALLDSPFRALFMRTPEYTLIFGNEFREFKTNASGMSYLTELSDGINKGVRKVLAKLKRIGEVAERGALILTALNRFNHV